MSYSVLYQDIGIKDYKEAWDLQEKVFRKIISRKIALQENNPVDEPAQPGTLILVEHPHVYTLGKSGSEDNLLIDHIQLQTRDAQFFRTNRGGDITYHGPGQIVGYPIFDLEEIGIGLREYISRLEEAVILTVAAFGIRASRLKDATGVWLDAEQGKRPRKICAIGVRASKYVTMHGFAFNVNTDLTYFNYINPCGYTDKGVTSLEKELGGKQDLEKIKLLVKNNLREVFDLKWIN
ncbi:MAG: lipoyl(octanoyl) transferase LipB [Bacteroidales bacterium]|nr:lipoyl(octanoyl) transferase LipB [Bacteroidales bacterium]